MEKLIKIQSELKAPKNQRNNFGNYNYRSCEDILEALKPILLANNCTLKLDDDIVMIGNRFYVCAFAIFTDNDTKETITVKAFAREEETKKGMDGSQITGASSSYARKYALNGLFLIDDTKDSDVTNKHGKDEEPTIEQPKKVAKKKLLIGSDVFNRCREKYLSDKSNLEKIKEFYIVEPNVEEELTKE